MWQRDAAGRTRREVGCALAALIAMLPSSARARPIFDIRDHGARGDGVTLDTDAVNRAIEASARAGGGTVRIPAGHYPCFSIRLRSNVAILLEKGAVVEAADPARHGGRYDDPEPGSSGLYQDFGHSHWRNSLFWGDGIENVSITGPGMIHGLGLTREGPRAGWTRETGERPLSMRGMSAADIAKLEPGVAAMRGLGNKAISLKNCRGVHLSDFTLLRGGHIGILLTGVRGVTIDRLVIDTQRDGIDLDAVTDATVTNCRVNSPNDDAIVVKASYGLERLAASENIVIRDCEVSGYDLGTLVDGTRQRTQQFAPDRDRPTGRIKLGTESNGGYRHILIERCRFDHCRGLALETVDGGAMEDVTVRSLRLNDVTSAPIFVRLGDRRRGPSGTQIGSTRGITISDFEATAIDPRFAAMIAGIPGHPVTGVMLRNIHLQFLGGGSAVDAARVPEEHPEAYPEPSMFGTLPAWGLWVRHARDVTIDRLTMETLRPDARPPILVQDAQNLRVTGTPLWKGPS